MLMQESKHAETLRNLGFLKTGDHLRNPVAEMSFIKGNDSQLLTIIVDETGQRWAAREEVDPSILTELGFRDVTPGTYKLVVA
ncbi:MAG: hypothetical protein WAV21_01765 [Minisyncoccia bacterium]